MLRRIFPLKASVQVVETNIPPNLPQFETKCLVGCNEQVSINNDNNPNRTLAVWKMQADTAGTARVVINITLGTAKVRVYDHPLGTIQGDDGENVIYKSIDPVGGALEFTVNSDVPYLFIDFTEKTGNVQITAQIQCYTNTSAATNPPAYYPECVDDEVTIEEDTTLLYEALKNDIRKDLFQFPTLRVVSAAQGSAVAVLSERKIAITAPAWVGVPSVYPVHYAIKDNMGIEHCGTITVTTQNSAVTIEPIEAVDDYAEVNENESVVIGVLDNDIGEMIPSSVRIKTQPTLGVVSVNADGTITFFAPSVGADTQTTFEYEVNDYLGLPHSATVTVDIYNTPPAAQLVNDDYTFEYLHPISVQPTQNDMLTGLDLSSIRTTGVIGAVTNPRFEGLTFKADSVITTNNIFLVLYEIDTLDGLTTLQAQMTFRKKGTGTQPITFTPNIVLLNNSDQNKIIPQHGNLSFGNVELGANSFRSVTIKNTGSATLSISSVTVTTGFTVQNYSGSIPPNGQVTLAVVMDSSTAANQTGTLTVNSNASPAVYIVNLNGGINENLAPKLTILDAAFNSIIANGGSKSYGNVPINQSSIRLFIFRNDGNTALTVTSVTASNDFSTTGFSGSIPAGGSVTVQVIMSTVTGGAKTGVLTVISDDSNSPYTINLNGTVPEAVIVTNPDIQLIDVTGGATKTPYQTINFGTHETSETVMRTLRIRNNGNANLVISSITDPIGFTSSGYASGTLTPGETQDFIVTLDTATEGTKEGLLVVNSNDPDTAAFNVNLLAVVNTSVPALIVENAATNQIKAHNSTQLFPTVEVDENGIIIFELKNLGDNTLNVSNIAVSGGFTLESIFVSGQILSNSQQIATVKMDTATTGDKTGTLTVTSNDPTNATYIINLQGKVLAIPTPNILLKDVSSNLDLLDGDSLIFGTHETGFRASRFIQIKNIGTASLSVTSISISADFTSPAFSATIAAGAAEVIQIELDDTTLGSKAGTLTVNSNDPDTAAYTVDLVAEIEKPATPKMVIFDIVEDKQYNNNDTFTLGKVRVGGPNEEVRPAILFYIKNTGTDDLNITGASISEPFFETNILTPKTIEAGTGELFYFNVIGTRNIDQLTGKLKIYSNDPTNPTFTINLVKGVEYVIDGTQTVEILVP